MDTLIFVGVVLGLAVGVPLMYWVGFKIGYGGGPNKKTDRKPPAS
jgi:hypothetical protein